MRRSLALLLVGTGIFLAASPLVRRVLAASSAQDQAPTRREFTLTARDYSFSPNRVEATQDDLIKLTVQSADVAYGFAIDDYRLSRRVPAGGIDDDRVPGRSPRHVPVLFQPEQRLAPLADARAAGRATQIDIRDEPTPARNYRVDHRCSRPART